MIRAKLLPYLLQWCGAVCLGKIVAGAYQLGGWGFGFFVFLWIAALVEIVGTLVSRRG